TSLATRGTPAVQKISVEIELEDPTRGRIADPDEAFVIDEVVHHECGLTGGPVRRPQRPHIEELPVLVEDLHPCTSAVDDGKPAVGADCDDVDRILLVR